MDIDSFTEQTLSQLTIGEILILVLESMKPDGLKSYIGLTYLLNVAPSGSIVFVKLYYVLQIYYFWSKILVQITTLQI